MAILRILTTEVGAAERVLTLGDQPVRLGRADDNDIVLLEQSASRNHARIEPKDGGYEVVDLGSSGGVQLDGARITRHRLREGDELVIGGTRIRFVEHPGSQPTILPTTEVRPSSQSTEIGDDAPEAPAPTPAPPTDLGDADTILPSVEPTGPASGSGSTDLGHADTGPRPSVDATMVATHEPAPPPAAPPPSIPLPQGTVQAVHQPAPAPPPAAPPVAPPAPPVLEVEPVEPPKHHQSSNSSFVMGGGPPGSAGGSGGYSLDGGRGDGFALDTMPPTTLSRGPGVGAFVLLALLGAAASFGILVALQGVPW